MPIVRTYMCGECAHRIEITLPADQWDAPPPECPQCREREMRQEFKPVALAGSPSRRANEITEQILGEDYHVGDIQRDNYQRAVPKVRYKDQTSTSSNQSSSWGIAEAALTTAITAGREMRLKHGSGLDVLQQNLKNGSQADLIEVSKRRAIKVW